jgi:hypothetical protein
LAVTVTVDCKLGPGEYELVQLPDDKVQDVGLNVPPELLSVNETDPDGICVEFNVSITFTASVNGVLEFKVAELGVIVVPVERSGCTVREDVAVLIAWVESPE